MTYGSAPAAPTHKRIWAVLFIFVAFTCSNEGNVSLEWGAI